MSEERKIKIKTNNLKTKMETGSWFRERGVFLLIVLRNFELKFQIKTLDIFMWWKFVKAVLSVH